MDSVLIEQAKRVDLIELVGSSIPLRRASRDEWEGACPFCGGDDRFHVKADGFFCRQCHPEFGDAIDYTQWRHNVDFRGAVERLTGRVADIPTVATNPATARPAQPQRKPHPSGWATKAAAVVADAQERIFDGESYLAGRGIAISAAVAFGLGYRSDVPLPGTWDREIGYTAEPQPAIVIPWYRGGKLTAVRYRFTQLHSYDGTDGKPRAVKQSSITDSSFTGVLYGGHVLPEFCTMPIDPAGRCAEQLRTLVLCEGELNAISIWQETNTWKWDVLSVGSESQKLTPQAIEFAGRYGRVIVWMDKAEIARRFMSLMSNAVAINSPVVEVKALDANDMLQRGILAEFLLDIRVKACRGRDEMTRVLYQCDGMRKP